MNHTGTPADDRLAGHFQRRTAAEEIAEWFAKTGGHFRQVNRSELAVRLARPGSTVRAAFRKLVSEGTVIELPGQATPGDPADLQIRRSTNSPRTTPRKTAPLMSRRNKHDHRRPTPGGYLSNSLDPLAHAPTAVQLAHELIGRVAAELGWTATRRETVYPSWDIAAPETGHSLYATYISGRFQIAGSYPAGCAAWVHMADMPSIGVSASRDAEAIAADIRRRLLPFYWEPFAKIADAKTTDDARREQCDADATRLASIVEGAHVTPYANFASMLHADTGAVSATVRVQCGSVGMKLTGVPTDLAADILALVRRAE